MSATLPSVRNARTRRPRGYTAIEVLMAMTVMSIGAAAVISMQKAAVQSNLDARKTDVANSIARTWVERLERDAMQWTLPGTVNKTQNNMNNALLLSGHVTGQWFLPNQYVGTTTPEAMSPGFDILGRDLAVADLPSAQFCVNVRLTWLNPPTNDLMRADVRVLWPRGIATPVTPPTQGGFCTAAVASLADPEPYLATGPAYHWLYLTTTIRENATTQ